MKTFLLIVVGVLPFVPLQKINKGDVMSQKWMEVGLKVFGSEYKTVDKSVAEIITFHKNGTVEKELYGNLKFKGIWKFSPDSNKIAIEFTELNGNEIKGLPLNKIKPTDSIMKLSRDTLILGALGEYGNMRVHEHDDRYFIRVH